MNAPSPLIVIVLALASGLGVIAYKTPRIFKKLFNLLFVAGMLAMVAIGSWSVGYKYAWSVVSRFVDEKKTAEALKTLEQQGLSEFSFLYAILGFIFIFFLDWLAGEVIKHREEEKPKDKVNGN